MHHPCQLKSCTTGKPIRPILYRSNTNIEYPEHEAELPNVNLINNKRKGAKVEKPEINDGFEYLA